MKHAIHHSTYFYLDFTACSIVLQQVTLAPDQALCVFPTPQGSCACVSCSPSDTACCYRSNPKLNGKLDLKLPLQAEACLSVRQGLLNVAQRVIHLSGRGWSSCWNRRCCWTAAYAKAVA
eukprot:9780-Heterococcus_DN1.PRE.3